MDLFQPVQNLLIVLDPPLSYWRLILPTINGTQAFPHISITTYHRDSSLVRHWLLFKLSDRGLFSNWSSLPFELHLALSSTRSYIKHLRLLYTKFLLLHFVHFKILALSSVRIVGEFSIRGYTSSVSLILDHFACMGDTAYILLLNYNWTFRLLSLLGLVTQILVLPRLNLVLTFTYYVATLNNIGVLFYLVSETLLIRCLFVLNREINLGLSLGRDYWNILTHTRVTRNIREILSLSLGKILVNIFSQLFKV